MKRKQGGFLISKINKIGGRAFDKILMKKSVDALKGELVKIL